MRKTALVVMALLIVAALAIAVIGVEVARSQAGPAAVGANRPMAMGAGWCCGMCPLGTRGAAGMKAALNLTDEQVKAITDIHQQALKEKASQREALLADAKQLRELLAKDPVDEAAARKLIEKIGGEQTELRVVALQSHLAIAKVLTAEQRAKWRQMMAESRCPWLGAGVGMGMRMGGGGMGGGGGRRRAGRTAPANP